MTCVNTAIETIERIGIEEIEQHGKDINAKLIAKLKDGRSFRIGTIGKLTSQKFWQKVLLERYGIALVRVKNKDWDVVVDKYLLQKIKTISLATQRSPK